MRYGKCAYLCNHSHNEDRAHFHHLQNFPLAPQSSFLFVDLVGFDFVLRTKHETSCLANVYLHEPAENTVFLTVGAMLYIRSLGPVFKFSPQMFNLQDHLLTIMNIATCSSCFPQTSSFPCLSNDP